MARSIITMKSSALVSALVSAIVAGSTFIHSAQAADVLEEVVVTAQKREQKLLDIPMSIQAFTGDELEANGIRGLDDLVRYVPGASPGRSTALENPSYQIRGVSGYLGDSTTGYYLDDAAWAIPNKNWAPLARTFDVERVEVLRGPQGTLYGVSAMGGMVRFITADPNLEKFEMHGAGGWSDTKGGDDNYFGDIAVSVPLIEDKLAIRGVASYEERGGFAESPAFPGEPDKDEIETYRLKVLARPTERLTLKGMFQHLETVDDWGSLYLVTEPQPNRPVMVEPPRFPAASIHDEPVFSQSKSEYDVFSGYIGYDFGSFKLESSTGYIQRDPGARAAVTFGFFDLVLDTGGEQEIFTTELRAVSQGDNFVDWVVGGIYQDAQNQESVVAFTDVIPLPPPIGGPLPPPNLFFVRDEITTFVSENFAFFSEVTFNLMDGRLHPLIGLRYSEDERTFTGVNLRPPGPPGTPPVTTVQDDTFDSWSPRFNLAYDLSEDALVYANIARGFRSGTFNSQAVVADSAGLVESTVDPDEIWSYEIGGKFGLVDNALQLEVALYYWDWDDQQLNFSTARRFQAVINAGTVTAVGLDYGLAWATPIDGLTLWATGNFNDTEFDEVRNAPLFVNTGIVEGNQLPGAPERTHTFALDFSRPSPWGMEFKAYTAYSYIAEQGDQTTPVKGEPQHLLSARIGLQANRWGAHLVGDNLLDEDDPFMLSGSGASLNYPRTIGLEVRFDY